MCQKVVFCLQIDQNGLDQALLDGVGAHVVAVVFNKEAQQVDDQCNLVGHVIGVWKVEVNNISLN